MGDADVICLSSDDEIPTDEIPKKRTRYNEELRPKVELHNGNDIAIESRKRKFQGSPKPGSVPSKMSKLTTKAVIEEIIEIPSKEKASMKSSEKQTKAGSSNSEAWNPFNNLNIPKFEFEELNNELVTSNSEDWKIPVENLSTDSNKIHNNPNGSSPSVADVVHDFFSNGEKTTKDSEINAIAKSPSRSANSAISADKNVESPTTIRAKNVPKNVADETTTPRNLLKSKNSISWAKISSKSNDEGEKSSESMEIEILDLEANTPNSHAETSHADCSKVSSKSEKSSGDQSPNAESSDIVIVHASPRAGNPKIPIGNEVSNRSNDSPEIKIIDTPKIVPNLAIDKNSKSVDIPRSKGELTVSKNVKEPVKDIKSMPSSPASSNSLRLESTPIGKPIVETPKPSKVPIITSCEILAKDDPKIAKIINGTIAKPKIFSAENTLSKSPEESTTNSGNSAPTTISKVPVVVVNRITPQRVPQLTNTHNNLKSNGSESSKLNKIDESPDNSNEFDSKAANDQPEKSKVEDAKIHKENNSKPSNSKAASNSSESSVKSRKNENTMENEPKPGCSKEPDMVDLPDIPQLVVKTKMPVYPVNQDTFAMFLGLCLMVDRDEAMEKIVAKLKRYYDDMDPVYARSQEFEELLNEKRERIAEAGKERVYWYTKHVMDEMKARKNKRKNKAKEGSKDQQVEGVVEERTSANEEQESEEIYEEDTPEARRRLHNIKKIERAMKIVAKHIEKLEKAEVDLNDDDDANSNYIKLDRYQEKMIQLWNKMCEYTNEHADAGRSYLRPKHLRVTQIPSVNQAINSFINSKLVGHRKKSKKRRSFIDGIIFPDYMDILECIRKVNTEQKLQLDKRAQEKMARQAFTQLGEHLQKARKNDFWDTFSLNLEGSDDPAKTDNELKEKLDQNENVNRERMSKVFEEFARKQEEAKSKNSNDAAENEDEEDDDEEDDEEEEEEEDDKTSNDDIASDLELLEGEDDDETDKINDRVPNPEETNEEEEDKNKKSEEFEIIENEIDTNEKNNSPNESVAGSVETETTPIVEEDNKNEVNLVKVDDDEEEANEAEGEKKRSLLRIRSFAKPPESWQSSQEATSTQEDTKALKSPINSSGKTKIIETIDVTEDDKITVVTNNSESGKRLKTLTIAGKTVVVQPIDKNGNRIMSKPANVISPSRVIMVPKTPSLKNSISIVETPRFVSLQNSTNVRNISTVPNVVRTSQPGSMQFVRISQPLRLNSPVRMPNSAQQQIHRAPVQIVKQTPLVNVPMIRIAGATQIRTVNPQQRTILPAVHNSQASRGVLVQLQNGQYTRTTDVRQNSQNLQRRLAAVPGNVQQLRLAVPENPRVIRVAQTPANRSLQLQLEQTKNGHLIATSSTPKDGRGSNSRVATIVSANNLPVQSTVTNPKIRTIVLDVESNVSTAPATQPTPK